MSCPKVQGNFLLLSSSTNFVGYSYIYIYNIYIYTWNPNDPCFDWNLGLLLEGFSASKNRRTLTGSRYLDLSKDVKISPVWGGLIFLVNFGTNPIGSMYRIFNYIWLKSMVNVGKYTIHGSYGNFIHKRKIQV